MPWRSKQASLSAVRGCFGAAERNPKKRKKCAEMAHEARLFRGNKRKKKRSLKRSSTRTTSKRSTRKVTKRKRSRARRRTSRR
jgi:hypothetical protein